jgi:hypothetical protein
MILNFLRLRLPSSFSRQGLALCSTVGCGSARPISNAMGMPDLFQSKDSSNRLTQRWEIARKSKTTKRRSAMRQKIPPQSFLHRQN